MKRLIACACLSLFATTHAAFAVTENFNAGKAPDWTEVQGEWAVSGGEIGRASCRERV